MDEALLVADVPQEAPRIGTYSHFTMSRLAKAPSKPHALKPQRHRCRSSRRGGGQLLHTVPSVMSEDSQKKKKKPRHKTNLDMVI